MVEAKYLCRSLEKIQLCIVFELFEMKVPINFLRT